MTTRSHHDNVEKQFGSQASAYLTSAVHASGRDLQRLAERLADFPQAKVLDMGCGAGHASLYRGGTGCRGDPPMIYRARCWRSVAAAAKGERF
ncbi:SAM-dependent methyltransferase [Klebsiella pneumoniae]|uniref:SAM-dependent methyltransferase n=1 Tax=Klebsiella pneumoniae TaxID=573 RepID=A0A377ZL35_KLEPN|nr:SAM-dependent methyltransferase [Klebsiella pneumoniae]